jgi:hypothetical protein
MGSSLILSIGLALLECDLDRIRITSNESPLTPIDDVQRRIRTTGRAVSGSKCICVLIYGI